MTPLLLIGLVALALLTWSLSQRFTANRKRAELRLEGQVRYQDEGVTSALLVSETLGLKGKPDLLLQRGRYVIPVDKKPGRTPATPYLSQTMQLAAYCALVEERYGIRPPHGVLRFDDGDVEVPYTPALEVRLVTTLDQMRVVRTAHQVERSHRSVAKCRACGFKERCSERLG